MGDLASAGEGKKGKHISPIDSAKNLVGSRWTFGYQHHTRGTIDVSLQVPSPTLGKMPDAWDCKPSVAHRGSLYMYMY